MVTQVNDQSFQSAVLESATPVLVDFFATWCAPCKALAPALEEISKQMADKLRVVKLDVDESPEVAASYGITAMPTLVLFKGGREAWRRVGAAPMRTLEAELSTAVQ